MKVLLINAVCGIRSTGRICVQIADRYEKEGHTVRIAYGREDVPEQHKRIAVRIGNTAEVYWHALMGKLFYQRGEWSRKSTKDFLRWADEYDPDVLWLHNLHDCYINIEMLFHWIHSRPQMQIKWTQHDCWAFTGRCMHYVLHDCNQWKMQCEKCACYNKKRLVARWFDSPEKSFRKKRDLFSEIPNMEIITPSRWMAKSIKDSFLGKYPVTLMCTQIDTSVFKPTSGNFRKTNHLEDKFIILGVASAWSKNKGLFDFYKLCKMIDGETMKIVLVGLTDKQMRNKPKEIIGITKTNDARELAEIYTAADVFFNPTYADTYPTVNLEAEACGTKVVTYCTGGAPETVKLKGSRVIARGSLDSFLAIINIP